MHCSALGAERLVISLCSERLSAIPPLTDSLFISHVADFLKAQRLRDRTPSNRSELSSGDATTGLQPPIRRGLQPTPIVRGLLPPMGVTDPGGYNPHTNDVDLPVMLVQATAMGPRTLHIRQRMPGTNELLGNALTSRGQYAREKRKWQTVVQLYAREQNFGPIEGPVHFEFEFLEPNRRRDPDNLSLGAIKVLLDALCHAKILKDDGWDEVSSFTCTWKVSKDPGVRVTVR